MNEINRSAIIGLAGLVIVLMAVVIFVAWAADTESIGRLRDFVQFLDDHTDNPGKLILSLGALVLIVLALLVIIAEVAPEGEGGEIRIQQEGATTIVPAQVVRERLEQALLAQPHVTAAKAEVTSRGPGVLATLHLTVSPDTSAAFAAQDAARVVAETVENQLGLPVAGVPVVRLSFAPASAPAAAPKAVHPEPVEGVAEPRGEAAQEPSSPPEEAEPPGEQRQS